VNLLDTRCSRPSSLTDVPLASTVDHSTGHAGADTSRVCTAVAAMVLWTP
jgi:hypothetical protein